MGARPPEEPFEPQTAALIDRRARQLIGRYRFTKHDLEDIRQELAMHVAVGLRGHDPSRGSPVTYAAVIIDSKIASIVRMATAGKRDRRHVQEGASVEELLARGSEGTADQLALFVSIKGALAQLPPETRAVATLLMEVGQLEVARRLGLSRQEVRTERQRIAAHLRRLGLDPKML